MAAGRVARMLVHILAARAALVSEGFAGRALQTLRATYGGPMWTLNHGNDVTAAAFSPSGRHFLTADRNGTIRWFNTKRQTLAKVIKEHREVVESFVFSADGTLMLTTVNKDYTYFSAKVWNSLNGRVLYTLDGHTGPLISAVFSPDGALVLTASHDHTAKLWDSSTGERLNTLVPHEHLDLETRDGLRPNAGWPDWWGTLEPAVFSPDGAFVLTACTLNIAWLWNSSTGQHLKTLKHSFGAWRYEFACFYCGEVGRRRIKSAFFSPDGALVLMAGDYDVELWDSSTGRYLNTLRWIPPNSPGGPTKSFGAVFSSDKALVLTGIGNTAWLWNSSTGQHLTTLELPAGGADFQDAIFAVLSPDGALALTAYRGSSENHVALWNTSTGQRLKTLAGHTGWLEFAIFSPDGSRVLTVDYDGGYDDVNLWYGSKGH